MAAGERARGETGHRSRSTPVSKTDFIVEHCRGRRVLDVGCIQHSWEMSVQNPGWLHAEIARVASECVGIDFLHHDAKILNDRGFHIIGSDVLKDAPPGVFDVVVAGDLIEHLEKPSVLLDYIDQALTADGVAIISTPNASYVGQWWTILARGKPDISPEHVVLFDPITFASLVRRSRLKLKQIRWVGPTWWALWDSDRRSVRFVGRALHLLTKVLVKARPHLNSDFVAVLQKDPDASPFDPTASSREVMQFLNR